MDYRYIHFTSDPINVQRDDQAREFEKFARTPARNSTNIDDGRDVDVNLATKSDNDATATIPSTTTTTLARLSPT